LRRKRKMFSRAIYTDKFQGNISKKICSNSLKFGVPTPSKRGSQIIQDNTTTPAYL
jgi:hypothetical protein